MEPEYNHFEENHIQYDQSEEWVCAKCLKIVPASHPTVLDRDTCTCVEAGPFVQDHSVTQKAEAFEQQVYQYQSPRTTYHPPAQSYASSAISAPCPEGPEREDPNSKVTNGYLPVVVDQGLNEAQYRQSTSDPSGISLQMWRFLVDPDHNRPGYTAAPASPDGRFLAQDVYIRSQKRGTSNKRRKASHQSILSSSSGEPSFPGYDVDPMMGIGSWTDAGGYVYSGDEYPLTMSGLVEYPSEG
jgi:hypothetical protein